MISRLVAPRRLYSVSPPSSRDEEGLDRVVTAERIDRLISLAGLQTQEGMEQRPDNNPDYKGQPLQHCPSLE